MQDQHRFLLAFTQAQATLSKHTEMCYLHGNIQGPQVYVLVMKN